MEEGVLDPPVAAAQREQALRTRLGGGQTGKEIPHLIPRLAGLEHRHLGPDFRNLSESRHVRVVDEIGGDPDRPPFASSVTLRDGGRCRGLPQRGKEIDGVGQQCVLVFLSRIR